MDTINIKYIVAVMMVLVASAEKAVKLKLRTTSCKNSCTHFHHTQCPSSIMVDNIERSKKKDGYNVVVINNYSGKVVDTKHFLWFNNLMFWRSTDFKKFFRDIRHNSTVIIVFQNMCKQFETDWYTYLWDLKHNIPRKLYSYQAAIVACKGSCPDAMHESIPYTYYSSGIRFEKTMTLIFRAVKVRKKGDKNGAGKKDFIAESVGGIVGIIVFLAIIYSIYIYCKRKDTLKEAAILYKTTEQNETSQCSDQPIYEPLTNIRPKENIYEVVDQKIPPPYNYNYKETDRPIQPTAPPLPEQYSQMEHLNLACTSNGVPPGKLLV